MFPFGASSIAVFEHMSNLNLNIVVTARHAKTKSQNFEGGSFNHLSYFKSCGQCVNIDV